MMTKNNFTFNTYKGFLYLYIEYYQPLIHDYRNIKEINSWKDFSNFVFSYLNLELKLSFNSLQEFKEYVCNNELQMKLELNYILTLINIQPPLGIDDEDFKALGLTSIFSF